MTLPSLLRSTIRRSPVSWARACRIRLRPYQSEIALAIKDSILHNLGLTFVVILPRQSGKNETQAHLFAWLLYRFAPTGGRIISVSPTFKPQTQLCMDRVRSSLDACLGSRGLWKSSKGYSFQLGKAQLQFFSAEPRANVLGATASLLLSVDEAQSISIAKFDKDFEPMTASTNATRVFWGTAWTSDTLLERERRLALQAQQADGIRRFFYYTADDICAIVPSYELHMQRVLAVHGRNHPLVRTQYFGETVDAQSGLFTPARLALIQADQIPTASQTPGSLNPLSKSEGFGEGAGVRSPLTKCALPFGDREASRSVAEGGAGEGSPLTKCALPFGGREASQSVAEGGAGEGSPLSKCVLPFGEGSGEGSGSLPPGMGVGFLLDVAGMDESRLNPLHSPGFGLGNPGRDSTALSIVQIDLSTLSTLQRPTYHVVARHSWVGENHLTVFGRLKALAGTWHPQHILIDATGVGEGLWAMLDRAFPGCVIPVKFTQSEKSEIGWRFLSIIETGRFRDHVHTAEVHLQYTRCVSEILPGPQKTLRWGVPDGTRGPDGELIHDDFLLADSLVARLDTLDWYLSSPICIIRPRDPLLDMDNYYRRPHHDEFDHYYSRPDAL